LRGGGGIFFAASCQFMQTFARKRALLKLYDAKVPSAIFDGFGNESHGGRIKCRASEKSELIHQRTHHAEGLVNPKVRAKKRFLIMDTPELIMWTLVQ
jgi:hypothetical protein